LDDLVKNDESGGQEAAQLLRGSVSEYLKKKLPHDLEIVIRVYANMKGLGKTYHDTKILEQREQFDRFARAFNMGHPLCDFIDAGTGKECSDHKIRGMQYSIIIHKHHHS
jgi:Fe-S-cluster containining protein